MSLLTASPALRRPQGFLKRLSRVGAVAFLILLFCGVLPLQSQAAELVMFERDSCEWCAVWKEKIGPIYPKTPEGKRAPLRMVDLDDPRPADLTEVSGIRFTPTFVLMENGQEVGRIRGYPGEDFFWGLLGQLMKELPAS